MRASAGERFARLSAGFSSPLAWSMASRINSAGRRSRLARQETVARIPLIDFGAAVGRLPVRGRHHHRASCSASRPSPNRQIRRPANRAVPDATADRSACRNLPRCPQGPCQRIPAKSDSPQPAPSADFPARPAIAPVPGGHVCAWRQRGQDGGNVGFTSMPGLRKSPRICRNVRAGAGISARQGVRSAGEILRPALRTPESLRRTSMALISGRFPSGPGLFRNTRVRPCDCFQVRCAGGVFRIPSRGRDTRVHNPDSASIPAALRGSPWHASIRLPTLAAVRRFCIAPAGRQLFPVFRKIAQIGSHLSWNRIRDVHFFGAVQERKQLIIFALRDGVELMIVAAGAFDRKPEPDGADRVGPVHHLFIAELLDIDSALAAGERIAMKPSGGALFERGVREAGLRRFARW